ncbi:glycerophosphodiester phosphodiesterase [Rhodanobacter thiooxydans]|uniref:glycerophosphodiester phosphodiesterase n=1 Tax=Rhodanobacter thiooxydans TaxID=416169 RepID=A0A154QMS7_9GAMM|nr:glycerophosphoryl diester phosphodiesterase [Rhodanobacter thiooxydans LCS2]KZC25272.1 glycerophosphodiester phosphodiesterase [Rhodanobacter thiooxydans]
MPQLPLSKRLCLAILLIGCAAMSNAMGTEAPLAARVLVIGHRGASALRPEHTLASYGKAIADGADFIEPDLVMTKDGVPVARHENEIGGTTDVATHPEFAARKTTKTVDGQAVTGWFTEDFTLAELKTLRARERLPELRSTQYDGAFQIPTLDEIIDFVAAESATQGRLIGIIPEIKHGTYFQRAGLPLEDRVLAILAAHAYTRTAPVEIQSFEIANLKYLRGKLGHGHRNIRLLQLIDDADQRPYDVVAAGGKLSYGEMCTPAGLRAIATYADAIGPNIRAIIPLAKDGTLGAPTPLVRDAHAAKLELHPYTFRPENQFQAKNFRRGSDPKTFNEAGSIAEIRAYLDAGIDAFFTDDPALGRKALDAR